MKHQKQNSAHETGIEDAMKLISGLEFPYLVTLSQRLAEHIEERRKNQVSEALRQIEIIAKQIGLPITELLNLPMSGEKGTLPPKYADPHDSKRTWSGVGRKPFWIRDLEQHQGYTLDQLRIEKASHE